MPSRVWIASWLLSVVVYAAVAAPQPPVHAVGYVVQDASIGPLDRASSAGPKLELSGGAEPGKIWALIELPWRDRSQGFEDELRELERRIAEFTAADQPILVAIEANRGLESAQGDEGRRSWLEFLRAVSRRFAPRVRWYVLSGIEAPAGAADRAKLTGFDLKAASVTIRAEAPDAGVSLALADRAALARLEEVFAAAPDIDPYLDGVMLQVQAGEPVDAQVMEVRQALSAIDPGLSISIRSAVLELDDERQREDQVLRRAAEILSLRVDLLVLELPTAAGEGAVRPPRSARALHVMARTLHTGLTVSTTTQAGIAPTSDAPSSLRWSRYFDDKNFQEAIVYWSDDSALAEGTRASFEFDTVLRRNYRVLDPSTGNPGTVTSNKQAGATARIELPLAPRPRVLIFSLDKSMPGLEPVEDEQQIEAVRRTTIEEVIALYQRFQAFQDDRLHTLQQTSELRLRGGLGGGAGSVEVALVGDYFWDRAVGGEWTIREKYVEGVRLKWDTLPEIPYIGIERAAQPPLDLKLDKRYRYELNGESRIGEFDCWEVRFEPTDPSVSLKAGRAWIDKLSGALVRVSASQNNLDPPIVSSEETQDFRPIVGPDGTLYWLLTRSEGQQLYAVSGTNLVLQRINSFSQPRINDPNFLNERRAAYDSNLQMLRDTEAGTQWLTKNESGQRVVSPGKTRQTFLAGGLIKEGDSGVLPIAGVDYIDVDLFGKKKVLNVLFAGIFANATLSDPSLWGTKLDAGAALTLSAVPATERDYLLAEEIESRQVRRFTQDLSLRFGYPLWQYAKLKAAIGLSYNRFSRTDETGQLFQPPSDHVASSARLGFSFDRAGWGVEGAYEGTRRSNWDLWGAREERPLVVQTLEDAKTYSSYTVEVGKNWFLPYFQKASITAAYKAGSDLDRFSAFSFGLLNGERLPGFGGSGIRYDRGLLTEISYGFNINNAIKFDVTLENAQVHDERIKPGMSSHTGIGVAGNFPGPWQTFIRLDVGYSIASDLEQAEGDVEFYLVFLKLFGGR